MRTDDIIDIGLFIVILVIGLAVTLGCIGILQSRSSMDREERALIEVQGDNTPLQPTFSNDELTLMIVVQDRFMAEPKAIKVGDNTPILFNDAWFENKTSNINDVWRSYLKTLPAITDSTLYYDKDNWKVEVTK